VGVVDDPIADSVSGGLVADDGVGDERPNRVPPLIREVHFEVGLQTRLAVYLLTDGRPNPMEPYLFSSHRLWMRSSGLVRAHFNKASLARKASAVLPEGIGVSIPNRGQSEVEVFSGRE